MPEDDRAAFGRTFAPETWAVRDLLTAVDDAELELARRMGLGATDLAAVEHVVFADADLGPGELASRMSLSPAAVTEVVDRLERAGHVERHRDERDRRRVRLVPTEHAVGEVMTRMSGLFAALDGLVEGASPAERAAIRGYLERAAAAYRGWTADDGGTP